MTGGLRARKRPGGLWYSPSAITPAGTGREWPTFREGGYDAIETTNPYPDPRCPCASV